MTGASPPKPQVTEVVAAVLLVEDDQGTRFLLAQRPPDKAYGGYWEFPGGKVEAGESQIHALIRELQEELGITVEAAYPWLTRRFIYPHATVRIRFFRVLRWQGEIQALEHTGLAWVTPGQPAPVSPVLPANGPILDALALPDSYVITHAEAPGQGVDAELARVNRALDQGIRLIQVRDKGLPAPVRAAFARQVVALAHTRGARVLINNDLPLARQLGADGVHLASAALHRLDTRPGFDLVAASCHNAADLARAVAMGCDFAVLGSVLDTPSHPDIRPLGWLKFASLVDESPIPVFAIGGLKEKDRIEAMASGAHGIALLRNWG